MPDTYALTTFGLRRLLDKVLPTDEDLQAFILDGLGQETLQRLESIQDRKGRQTKLLSIFSNDLCHILTELERLYPLPTERFRYLLDSEVLRTEATSTPAGVPDAPADIAMVRRMFGEGRPLLDCDRETSWERAKQMLRADEHMLALLPGARGEAHKFFLCRFDASLDLGSIPHRTVWVHWNQRYWTQPYPTAQSDMLSALTAALGLPAGAELREHLSAQLYQHHLIFLGQDCIDRGFADDAVVQFCCHWLPELLAPLRTKYRCKFIQPIAWESNVSGWRRLLARLERAFAQGPLSSTAESALSRELGWELCRKLLQRQSATLPIIEIDELQPIARADILKFLRIVRYAKELPPDAAERARERLATRIMNGTPTSEQILLMLCMELRNALSSR